MNADLPVRAIRALPDIRPNLVCMLLHMKDQDNNRIGNLVAVIREDIDRRGFYILLDERAKVICGQDVNRDLRRYTDRIASFARKHGWDADIETDAIMFWPLDSHTVKLKGFRSQPLCRWGGVRISNSPLRDKRF
jgi:hypothetical protein